MTERDIAPGDFHFHGGIKLEGHKQMSCQTPVQAAPLPKTLILPVRQHIGDAADVLVNVGDYVAKGQKIAKASSYVSAPVHASTSGTVTAIEDRPVPHPSGLSMLCIEIEADGKDQWLSGLPNPVADYTALDALTLRGLIRDAGIVGLGGAAFPTAVKLNPPHAHSIETLVINGVECEPYISCDDRLMREHAAEILQGIAIIQHMIEPKQTFIGIEDNKPEAISALRTELQSSPLADTRIIVIPTLYPSGGERQLIKILTGKEIPSGQLPIQSGIVCQNVGTT
ncbi:MAG TPA: electron transport complex subunit RsxC, partial [Gammaproteobacteria bacterium]|nr:electron transport complex subunit RsxC [Gammaproteobacteria bacterium]